MTSLTTFQKNFILKRTGEAIFADIIIIVPCLLKKSSKTPENIKNYKLCIKMEPLYVFLAIAKFADFR